MALSGEPARLVALLGDPVAHSVSPVIHAAAFGAAGIEAAYLALRVEDGSYRVASDGLFALGALGANVTIPHKVVALHNAVEASSEAQAVGAANTLVRVRAGWRAENTDVAGFLAGLDATAFADKPVVVLGAGGAARAVVYALLQHVSPSIVTVAARDESRARQLASEATLWGKAITVGSVFTEAPVRDAALIINATPVGTANTVDTPWPDASAFHPGQTVYDLVYRPAQTRLLADAKARGARTIGGLPMLVAQAAASFLLWTGCEMDVPAATHAARQALGLAS